MRILLFILSLAVLFSCNENVAPKNTTMNGSNHQLESIKKDIKAQIASLSFEDKLELCLLDFSFASPKYYQHLLENKPDDVKATLLENEVFLKICKRRKIDSNQIPNNYFAAE